MSTDATAAPSGAADPAAEGGRRAALRLAFGVTACFVVVEALGSNATFVAPLLAAQMLVKLRRPPSLRQGIALILLIALSTGAVLALTAAFLHHPAVLILTLGLVHYLAFYAHRRGAPELATLLLQISAVTLPVLAVLSPDGAGAFAATLLSAGFVALVTVWAAHTACPAPAAADVEPAPAGGTRGVAPRTAARHALLETLVLLPILAWFILDASETAVVVLIVIVTLLRQADPAQGQRAASVLILGNLVGGVAAAIVYDLVLVSDTLLFLAAILLGVSLAFAGRIVVAGDRAPVYAIAFATFILLLGLGLTPLPGGSGEAFVSRLTNVLLASAYAVGGLALLERWRVPASSSGPT